MENWISAFPRRKRNWLLELQPLWRALSNGANHTSVAASVRKLLVVFTTQLNLDRLGHHDKLVKSLVLQEANNFYNCICQHTINFILSNI